MAGNVMEYSLRFTADTAQAKANIKGLQQDLQTLFSQSMTRPGNFNGFTKDIQQAGQVALNLKANLESAFNTNTNKLDLRTFNQNMQQSGMSLRQYRDALVQLGPQGQQAFSKLADGIVSAEIPLKRTNGLLTKFATTLANTVRWQISASMIRGFTSGIQEAFNYAKELNTSLNNIRIVTGYSAEQMSKFAVEANNAAKALSTTTTAYTDATLIFYQQGLTGDAVTERAETVIKMANVTGQTAQVVSDQMTAVWNNFYDGSKSLEYYADAMAALGAATASSTDEIAQGLEKFAAIADTVGLSYETATAALATVTAETRQSADIVGTAFKTIFARVEGLKLGETLEDGVDLNKYSEALSVVGVDIIDKQTNQIKEMDDILAETGAKWQTIGKEQQIALAQSVAGVRQYSQFIALMDNWDKVQSNIQLASSSEGTLQEQQEIYEESWKAASDRVKASMESIWQSLINDEFFIDLTDALSKLLDMINLFAKSIGGLPGVLSVLANIMLQAFGPQMTASIDRMFDNMQRGSQTAAQEMQKTKEQVISLTKIMFQNNVSNEGAGMAASYTRIADLQSIMLTKGDKLTNLQKTQLQIAIDTEKEQGKILAQLGQQADQSERQIRNQKSNLDLLLMSNGGKTTNNYSNKINAVENAAIAHSRQSVLTSTLNEAGNINVEDDIQQIKRLEDAMTQLKTRFTSEGGNAFDAFSGIKIESEELSTKLSNLNQKILEYKQKLESLDPASENYEQDLKDLKKAMADINKEKNQIAGVVGNTNQQLQTSMSNLQQHLVSNGISTDQAREAVQRYATEVANGTFNLDDFIQSLNISKDSAAKLKQELLNMPKDLGTYSFGQVITQTGQLITSFSMLGNSIKGMFNTLKDENMSPMEKFLSVSMSVGMILTTLSSLMGTLSKLWKAETVEKIANTAATWANTAAEKANAKAKGVTGEAIQNSGKEVMSAGAKFKSLGKSLGTMISSIGNAIVGAIGGTAAAILGIVAAIAAVILIAYGIKKVFDKIAYEKSLEKKLKDQQEETKKLNEQLQKQSQQLDDLKSKWDSLQNAEDALKDLTKGTQEWNEAILKINQQVLELIDLYPMLAQYLNSDGDYLSIDEEGYNKLLQMQTASATIASRKVIGSQIKEKELESGIAKEDYKNNYGSVTTQRMQGYYGYNGNGEDEIKYTLFDHSQSIGERSDTSFTEQQYKDFTSLHEKDLLGIQKFEAEFKQSDEWKNLTKQEQQYLQEQINAAKELAGTIETNNGIVSNLNESYENTLGIGETSQEKAAASQAYEVEYAKLLAQNKNKTKEEGETWLKNQNIEYSKFDKDTGNYEDSEGKVIGNVWEEMSAQQAYINISNAQINGEFKNGLSTTDRNAAALRTGNFGDMAFNTSKQGANISTEDLMKQLGFDNMDQMTEYAKQQGYESAEAYAESYRANVSASFNQSKDIQEEIERWGKSTKILEGLGIQAVQDVADMGDDLGPAVIDALNKVDGKEAKENLIEKIKVNKKDLEGITNPKDLEKALQDISNNAKIDKIVSKSGLTKTQIEEYTNAVLKNNSALQGNKEKALEVVEAQLDLDKKFNTLKTTFDELSEKLKSTDPTVQAQAYKDLGTALDTFYDAKAGTFDADFVNQNIDTITQAMNGNIAAQKELQQLAVQEIVFNITGKTNFEDLESDFQYLLTSLQDMPDLEVGATLETGPFMEACNRLLSSGAITADQLSSMIRNALGYNVEIGYKTVTATQKLITAYKESGFDMSDPVNQIAAAEHESSIQSELSVPVLKVISGNGNTFGGNILNKPPTTGSGGGGGSTPKSSEPKKFEKTLDDYVERYHEITLAIDDQTRALSKLTEMKDKAYGKSRLYWIKEEIEATKDYIDLLKRQRTEINSNLDLDKTAAEAVGFIFDENGNVNNYDEIMSNLYTNTKNAYSGQHEEGYTFSSDAEKEAYEKDLQDRIEAAEKKEEDTKKALQKYEETYSKFKELEQNIIEEMIKQADLEVEGVTAKFELEIETFDRSIELFGAYAEAFGESASDLAFVFKNYQNDEKNKQINSSKSEIASLANERQYNANILMNQYGVKFKEDGSIDESTIPEEANWARFKYESYASDYDEKILEFIPNMLENMVQLAKDNSLGYWEKDLNDNKYNQNRLELLNNETFGKEYIKNLNKIIGINDQNIKTLNDRIIGNQNAAKGAGASLNALLDSLGLTNYKIDSENMENLSAIDLQNITEEIKTRIDKANETQDFILANSLQNTLAEIIGHSGQISQYIDQVNEDRTTVLEKEQKNRTDKLERITNTIEYIIESEKRQIELLEWQQEWLQRNPYSQANQAINLQEQAILQRKNYDTAKAGFDAIVAGYQAENRGPTAEEKAQMESFYDIMKESTQNILTIQDSFLELVPSVLEEISGVFDKFTSQLEGITGKLSSMENILGLLGIEDSGLNQSIRDAQFELGNAGVDNAAKKFETLKNNYLEIERDYQKALKQGDEASQKILKDQLDNAKTMIVEAENDMWTKISELITQVTEDFKKHIEDMMRISNEELDKMSDKFSKNSELQKQYLTDTQKVYELSKLSRQLEQDISNMDDINSKMALKEILEEINALQADSNKMSKFDLDVLKAEYEVEKARIALEDAQQAKNTMRLVRNANGGYSYAYTANQTEIDKAQQTYEDKIYNLQKLMEDYLEELGKTRIEIQKGLNDELAKLNPNDFETQKEFEAEVQRIIDYWSEKFNYNTDEMSKVMKMLGIDYKDTSYGMIANNSSLEEDTRQFASNIKFYTQEASTAWETWSERTNIAIDDVADSTEDLAENVKDYTEDISDYIIDLQEETEEPLAKLNNQLSLLSDEVASWFTNSDFAKGLNTMYNGLNDIAEVLKELDNTSLLNLPDVNYDTKRKLVNEIVWLKKEWTKGNNTGNEDLKNWAAETAKSYYNELEILDSGLAKKLQNANYDEAKIIKEEFDKFDTGGYTGEWGSEGRIAMLHQKELVLNASDTQNILDAVQLVRSIGEDLVASALPKEFLTNFVRTAGNTIGKQEEIFQQDIQINANFPNVSSREEIEQAFNSLAQRAVQYANRKNL